MSEPAQQHLAFGVHADTGLPLAFSAPASLVRQLDQEAQTQSAAGSIYPPRRHYGVLAGFDPEELDQVGWGLVFASDIDPEPYLEQLSPLLALRKQQAGARFRIFSGSDGPNFNESANGWLNRHGASLFLLDPDNGVPFYLLLIGSPEGVSFEFQYSLDIVAGVGRLDFPTLNEYRQYANSVVRHEQSEECRTRPVIELFATCHDFDAATQLFTEKVARPVSDGPKELGKNFGFSVRPSLKEQSTKARLKELLTDPTRAPSLLFTGTHGMAFDVEDPRHAGHQGALVCHDWPGYGAITEEHWFSAQDVPTEANIHGMIHFFFACYGCGTPEYDNYHFSEQPRRIAKAPATARLAQKLLAMPQGGALASLGHIDRAWASSFMSETGKAQPQLFFDVIHKLMKGNRVGHATDQLNNQWGAQSTELVKLLVEASHGKSPSSSLMTKRIARDDVRNYVVLGDPAVRLRIVSSSPEL